MRCVGLAAPTVCGFFPDWDLTCVPCIGKWILNHWTTKGNPTESIFDTRCVVFSTPSNCLWTPTGCRTILLRADTDWSLCRPHRLQAQPPTTFPISDADPSGVSSGHPHSRLTQPRIRSSQKARPQVCSFAIMTHRAQGNICVASVLQDGHRRAVR